MPHFRKKPVVIEAWKVTDGGLKPPGALIRFEVGIWQVYDHLHDTYITFEMGDWIVKGTQGEFYPVADSMFNELYEGVAHAVL